MYNTHANPSILLAYNSMRNIGLLKFYFTKHVVSTILFSSLLLISFSYCGICSNRLPPGPLSPLFHFDALLYVLRSNALCFRLLHMLSCIQFSNCVLLFYYSLVVSICYTNWVQDQLKMLSSPIILIWERMR